MAGDATQYLIDIATRLQGADSATVALAKLGDNMAAAGASAVQLEAAYEQAETALAASAAATSAAAEALKAGEAAYAKAETRADNAAKAVERVGQAMQQQQAKVDAMRSAVAAAASAHEQAAAAAAEANESLKRVWSPQLVAQAEQLEVAAAKAGAAHDKLLAPLGSAEAKLAQLNARHEEATAKASAAQAALGAEGASLDKLRAEAAAAANQHRDLGEGLRNIGKAADQAAKAEDEAAASAKKTAEEAAKVANGSGKVNELAEAFGRLGGPVGMAGQKLFGLIGGLEKFKGSAGASAGLALGVVAAVAAVTLAFIAGTAAIIAWSFGMSDARRNAALNVEAVSRTSESLAHLGDILPAVQGATGLATDRLTDLAKQLDEANVSAADMPEALRAVSIAEAALGQGAGGKLVADLKAGKKSAAELAAEMESKFGDIVAKKLLSLDAQSTRLKTNLQGTFGSLKIEGALQGLSLMVGLLDSSTASGKALKFIFDKLFQPIVDAVSSAAVPAEAFFIGLEIGALKAYVMMKPLIKVFNELSGSTSDAEGTRVAMQQLGETIGEVAAVAGAVLYAMAYPFIKIAEGIGAAIKLSQMFAAAVQGGIGSAISWLESISLADIGANMMRGLAQGITGSAGEVIDSIKGAVGSAVDAAVSLLRIGSPSKLFHEIGGYTAEGFALGVEDGTDGAQSALESMVEPPEVASAPAGAGSGASLNLAGASFNFYGVKDAEDAESRFGGLLTRLFEGDALQLGGGEVPA